MKKKTKDSSREKSELKNNGTWVESLLEDMTAGFLLV